MRALAHSSPARLKKEKMTYKVILKRRSAEDGPGGSNELRITATDVRVVECTGDEVAQPCNCAGVAHWFNFTDEEDITVAAIPFDHVLYIVS